MKRIIILAASLLLSACGATTGLGAHSSVSRFDGSRVVDIEPHGTWCGMTMTCTGIGAQWSSAHPLDAFLIIEVLGEYTGIHDAQLRVDGKTYTLMPSASPTSMTNINIESNPLLAPATRQSDQYFSTPLELVRKLASAKQASLRVFTTDGYIDSTIIDGHRDTKAYYAMRRFLAQVDASKP